MAGISLVLRALDRHVVLSLDLSAAKDEDEDTEPVIVKSTGDHTIAMGFQPNPDDEDDEEWEDD